MSLLNNLIKSENYMCIYRNFLLMKNYQKIIVFIRIFLELCVTIIIITHKIFFWDLGNVVSSLLFVPYCYQALVLLKNLVIVVGSVLNSKSFLIVNEKTKVLHNRFRNEPSYSKSVKILNLKCSVISIAFLILVFIVIIIRIYIISFNKDRFNKGRVVIIILFEAWVDVRFMLEHLVIYTVITLIYDFLKCLNNYVYEDLKKYNIDTKDEQIHLDEQFNETADKLTVWTEVYQDILSCTKNTSICFNELVLMSMGAVVMSSVFSFYDIIGIIIKYVTNEQHEDIRHILYVLVYHLVATFPLLFAGQRLQNEFATLNKALVRLSSVLSIHKETSKTRPLRDLIRMVTKNPITIKFSHFSLGMYLMPFILSISITYVVVMLQFNHVI